MACDSHFVNYFAALESLAISVRDMKHGPDDVAKKIVGEQADEALTLKEEMAKCPSCVKIYQDSKP